MKMTDAIAIFQHLLVANRKQRAPQGCKYRQLIFRPLDGRKGRTQSLDLCAIVKGAAADQQMWNSAGFESLDVGPRHVLLETDKSAEEQTDMARLNRHPMFRLARPKAERRCGCQ